MPRRIAAERQQLAVTNRVRRGRRGLPETGDSPLEEDTSLRLCAGISMILDHLIFIDVRVFSAPDPF